MSVFGSYLNTRKGFIALVAAFAGILAAMFALYRLPFAAVGYAGALCLFLTLVVGVVDYLRFARTHAALGRLEKTADVSLEDLPEPWGALERDYQTILRALREEERQRARGLEQRYGAMQDYYTLWVHQVKTPIAAMRLELQSRDTAADRELLEELQRIEQYVDMVLTYLRLDAATTDYVIRDCDLDTIVRAAVRKFAPSFIRRRLKLDYQPLNCRVLTDEKWLGFVVEQVLSNALKYTRAGSVSIALEAPKTLVIRDTGMGIAPEDLPRIFDQGYTGYMGRSDQRATGIGLYLCRRVCQNLCHTIQAKSVVGQGTAIYLGLDSGERQKD